MRLLVLAFIALALSGSPQAQSVYIGSGKNSVQSGEFTVHYNALSTTQIPPEVAQRSGITRSANRALVNIAVRRGRAAESVAVAAKVEASATNMAGQRQTLQLREVREGDAIYYLGEARIEDRDTLSFEVTATPEGGTPIRVMFAQEFWPAMTKR
jgi:hypothetical protein